MSATQELDSDTSDRGESSVDECQKLFDGNLVVTCVPAPLLEAVDSKDEHPRFSAHYKNWFRIREAQQRRRVELIQAQKQRRDKQIAQLRGLIAEIERDSPKEDKPAFNENHFIEPIQNSSPVLTKNSPRQPLKCRHAKPVSISAIDSPKSPKSPHNLSNSWDSPRRKTDLRQFRNKIMLSEWMIDRPTNFEAEWIFKAVPIGKRCLIVSSQGQTVAYSRTGLFLKSFQSRLPGGHKNETDDPQPQWKNSAILDCVYDSQQSTFFVLDIILWNEVKLYESEAEFRFFWIESRFAEEQSNLNVVDAQNECRFYPLPARVVSDAEILKSLQDPSTNEFPRSILDGLLFFFKTGLYVPGLNPLALWLKPEMLEPVLNIHYKHDEMDDYSDNESGNIDDFSMT